MTGTTRADLHAPILPEHPNYIAAATAERNRHT
jgi:hypothetical protein